MSEAPAPGPRPGRRFLHLFVLSGFCVAEPLFFVTNPTLFAGYGAAPIDVFVVATVFVVVPPVLLLGLEQLLGLAGPLWRERAHLVFVGALAAVGVSTLLLAAGTIGRLLAAVLGGVGFAFAYRRFGGLRKTLTVLSPVPVVFLLLYLLVSPVSEFTLSSQRGIKIENTRGGAPVVMMVFDELPLNSLLRGNDRIDARRYPNFARLARGSDWFRGATTVNWETEKAVPALVSGRRSRKDEIPAVFDHPRNLFTLLGRSYDVRAEEPYARLCPERVCHATGSRSFGDRLASLTGNLTLISSALIVPDEIRRRLSIPAQLEAGESNPANEVDRFLGHLDRRGDGRPRLDYIHALLPHVPWERMPSGKQYPQEEEAFIGLQGKEKWSGDKQKVLEGFQRHLLQLAYTDRVLGRVLDKLRATGAYDRSLIIVSSDHGSSFRTNQERREPGAGNAQDILPVPLFIKLPGQRRGRTIDRHVQTIDVLPTIADVLGIRLPFKTEGRSVFARGPEPAPAIYLDSGKRVSRGVAELRRERLAALRRQIGLFGTGPADPTLFEAGPRPQLVGRELSSLAPRDGDLSADVRERVALEHVDLSDGTLPTRISGKLSKGGRRDIAVALNGVIATTTGTYSDDGGDRFAALVPERALRNGGNELRLFEVGPGGSLSEISVD